MKRIRSEHISSTVNHYLKKRQYIDGGEVGQKRERRSSQTLQEMALSKAIVNEGSLANYISYSSISGDATACDQQYTKIKGFISEAVEPYGDELKMLLYPLFVHVYLELLCNGQKTPAHKFYSRHHGMFRNMPECQAILDGLQQMFNMEDVLAHKDVNEYRNHKYSISLSSDAQQYLFRYLKSEDNVLLLQVFNKHIDLKVQGRPMNEDLNHPDDRLTEQSAPASPSGIPDNKTIQNAVTLTSLQQSIKRVRDGPASPSTVCFYTFLNTFQGLCSSSVSRDQALLCGGFEDSSVRVWSLTPDPLTSQPCEVNVSHVHLAGDYEEDIKSRTSLGRSLEPETVSMLGHSGGVYDTCFTCDNSYLLSASDDTTVRLWDMKTHTNKVCYRGHNYPVWSVDASSVSEFFATGSHDRTAKLWCTERLYPIRTFVGHMADVDVVKFHPNSNYIATGSLDKTVRLWTCQDANPVRLFHGHKVAIKSLAFSHDGKYLASAGEDRHIRLWDLSCGTLYKELRGHTDTVYSLCFNRDGTVLASGGLDCMLRMWDIHSKTTPSTSSSDCNTSAELMAAFPTKGAVVHFLQYSKHNLLLGSGGLLP